MKKAAGKCEAVNFVVAYAPTKKCTKDAELKHTHVLAKVGGLPTKEHLFVLIL